tara:strand:- start:469 stop:639 length:171 start_codon:yes stop_codon:yes gene_type:complete
MADYKKLADEYESCDKKELIERLIMTKAQLLTAEKEVDRLNEYIQIIELEEISKKL